MSVFRKILPGHSAADGMSPGGAAAKKPLSEIAFSRKGLDRQDVEKIEEACKSLEAARRILSNTLLYGENRTNMTRESRLAEVNTKLAELAHALKEIAKQNPEAQLFEFRPIDIHEGAPDVSPHLFHLEVIRTGYEKLFAVVFIETDNRDSENYSVVRYPLAYLPGVDKFEQKGGSIGVATAGLKELMTDILNYELKK